MVITYERVPVRDVGGAVEGCNRRLTMARGGNAGRNQHQQSHRKDCLHSVHGNYLAVNVGTVADRKFGAQIPVHWS